MAAILPRLLAPVRRSDWYVCSCCYARARFRDRGAEGRSGPPGSRAARGDVRLNIVTDRLDGDGFDLIVATNVFVYYDVLDQALALANVASMLRPGGFFLTNTAMVDTSAPTLRLAGLDRRDLLARPAVKRRRAHDLRRSPLLVSAHALSHRLDIGRTLRVACSPPAWRASRLERASFSDASRNRDSSCHIATHGQDHLGSPCFDRDCRWFLYGQKPRGSLDPVAIQQSARNLSVKS